MGRDRGEEGDPTGDETLRASADSALARGETVGEEEGEPGETEPGREEARAAGTGVGADFEAFLRGGEAAEEREVLSDLLRTEAVLVSKPSACFMGEASRLMSDEEESEA